MSGIRRRRGSTPPVPMRAGRGMSEMEAAAARLERAVARLEAATKRLAEAKPADQGEAEATSMVAARLEEAIQRIDQLLEE